MPHRVAAAPTVEHLRKLVHEQLCSRDRLDPAATPLQSARVKRGGKPCGLWFQVDGPRLMKAYAIWIGPENRIVFYDSAGERFDEMRLSEAPDPESLAA